MANETQERFWKAKLESLASGEEIEWDYICTAVEKGELGGKQVLPYLKKCLAKLIPVYERGSRASQPFDGGRYFSRRLDEAREALAGISKGNHKIKYRGRSVN